MSPNPIRSSSRFTLLLLLAVVLPAFAADAPPQPNLPAAGLGAPAIPLGRIGFTEDFTATLGWTVTHGAPLASMHLNQLPAAPAPQFPDGTPKPHMLFTTVCGALNKDMHRDDWPEWPKQPFDFTTIVRKTYDTNVNLDTYHYLVIDLPIRGTNVVLSLNGVSLPIAYTSGVHAYDLKRRDHPNLKSLQKISLAFEFLNTSASVGVNAIRLEASLTTDEQKGLLPEPVDYTEEKATAHPYQHLEALNVRAGRARHAEYEGQLVIYHDSVTHAEVWKLTDQPGDQCFRAGDNTLGWSADGRFFQVNGGKDGKNVFDFQTGTWLKTALAGGGGGGGAEKPLPDYAAHWDSKKHPGVVYGYNVDYAHGPDKIFRFYAFDAATGKETEFAQWKTQAQWAVRELALSDASDKAVVGLRESNAACVVDPDNADAAQRAQPVTLSTRLKGIHFGKNDTTLIWHNCYTYEQWERVIAPDPVNGVTGGLHASKVGDTHLAYYMGGGHAGGGGGFSLNHYEGMTVIHADDLTDWMAGDQVKIFAYYKHPFDTDYGALTNDGQLWVVNGAGQDVANEILMINGKDCKQIIRCATMNTSRNDWPTNTYTLASPEGRRVAWVSDQLGDGDVYFVVVSRPTDPKVTPVQALPVTPPLEPKIESLPHSVLKLIWKPSAAAAVFRTEIFACAKPDDPCDNTTVVGAVLARQPQQFFDWGGGAPGATVVYKLIAVSADGQRSAPATVTATWPALEKDAKPVTIKLQAIDLIGSQPDFEVVTRANQKMAIAKAQTAEAVNQRFRSVFSANFNVPVAGDYAIWVCYAPGYAPDYTVKVTLDANLADWKLRCPYRPMSGTLAAPKEGEMKIFCDRFQMDNDDVSVNEFALEPGDHHLKLLFEPRAKSAELHAIQTIWITNDPSFRPPGYDPRADFKK